MKTCYYPQIDVSGKDVVNFSKRQPMFEPEDIAVLNKIKDLCNIEVIYTDSQNKLLRYATKDKDFLKEIEDLNNVNGRKYFASNLRNELKRSDLKEEDLLYAFPNSEGNIIVDGNKYKNVGTLGNSAQYYDPTKFGTIGYSQYYSYDTRGPIGIAVFCILERRLRTRRKFLKSLRKEARNIGEYEQILSEECQIGHKIILPDFFDEPNTIISKTCKSLTMTDGVEQIRQFACSDSDKLTHVSFPNTLKTIGYEAFCNCHFLDNVRIPGSVKIVEEGAFEQCTNLKNLSIEKGVKKIGDFAFNKCDIRTIDVPGSVMKVGTMAFYGNKHMSSVKLGNGIRNIGNGAFTNPLVKEIVVPNSVRTIEERHFDKIHTIDSKRFLGHFVVYVPKTKNMEDVIVPEEKVHTLEK